MRPTRRLGVLFAVVLALAPLPAAQVGAQAQPQVNCGSEAPFFIVDSDDGLSINRHAEPETGVDFDSWSGRAGIGNGWSGNLRVGPDGWVYRITPEGAMERYRWVNGGWQNDGVADVIAESGWEGWGDPEARNRMTVDQLGDFYGFPGDDALHWWHLDQTTKTFTERVIDVGWGSRFDMIFAAGPGILYARQGGDLHRFQYDAASERWLEYDRVVGNGGWDAFTDAAGVGGDIFYVLNGETGDLHWYRYNGNGEWERRSGDVVGRDFSASDRVDATTDTCKFTTNDLPTHPVVPAVPHAPASLLATADGRVHYSYVDTEGKVVNAQVTDLTGGSPFGFAAVPGNTGATGTPAAADDADNRVRLLALGTDSEIRANRQLEPNGAWSATSKIGGFLVGSPAFARRGNGLLSAFGVDGAGCLWRRDQVEANGDLLSWRQVSCDDLAPVAPTAVRAGTTWYLTVLRKSGSYQTAVVRDDNCCAWTQLPGTGFTGPAAAIADGNGKLRLFARGTGNVVHTLAETASGFGAWTGIPGVTAAGAPSAVLAPNGNVEVVVRATDGYIYNTGSQALGSPAWRPWREVTDFAEQSSVDPTAVSVPGSNAWVVAFRDQNDAPKLRRAQGGGAQARTTATGGTAFVTVPLTAAH